jgi:hypothetical protein
MANTEEKKVVGRSILAVLTGIGAIVTWNRGPEFGPHWYPLALVVTALPAAWLGAKFHLAQHAVAVSGPSSFESP